MSTLVLPTPQVVLGDRGASRLFDEFVENSDRLGTQPGAVKSDGGQSRVYEGTHFDVVAADYGNVVGYLVAAGLCCAHGTDGHQVVVSEYAVEAGLTLKQLLQAVCSATNRWLHAD